MYIFVALYMKAKKLNMYKAIMCCCKGNSR